MPADPTPAAPDQAEGPRTCPTCGSVPATHAYYPPAALEELHARMDRASAGFAQADLGMLDEVADELQGRATEFDVRALRDRIAGLLPPRSADPLKSPPGY